jgi:hypothetical protein
MAFRPETPKDMASSFFLAAGKCMVWFWGPFLLTRDRYLHEREYYDIALTLLDVVITRLS